jgi:hypothetical protein
MGGMVAAATNLGPGVGAVVGSARWGVVRLVRTWLGPDPLGEHGRTEQLEVAAGPAALPPGLTVIWQADLESDRHTASLALHEVLSEWRAAERSLVAMAEGSSNYARAQAEVAALRLSYQGRFEAVRTRLHAE